MGVGVRVWAWVGGGGGGDRCCCCLCCAMLLLGFLLTLAHAVDPFAHALLKTVPQHAQH